MTTTGEGQQRDERMAQGSGRQPTIEINTIGFSDVGAAVVAGFRDFTSAPVYGLFFGGFYALAGWLILTVVLVLDLQFLAYPIAAGFALIAPFIASGIYEVSRRQEAGMALSWGAVFGAIKGSGARDLGWMAVVTTFMMVIWIEMATVIYLLFFGLRPLDWPELVVAVTGTGNGLLFLLIGNVAGAILGMTVFSLSAVSFPLLLDRDIDFVTAMITSVRSVLANPAPMVLWAAGIAVGLAMSLLSVFVGLFVILPVLGHATWHMYRRLIPSGEPAAAAG